MEGSSLEPSFNLIGRIPSVADATGTFSLDWSILGTGIPDTFGLGGFDFSFTGVANQFLDFNTSGSLIRPVVSGDTYTAGLNGLHGLGGNLGTRSANENAIFDFSMTTTPTTAVPEPTSFVLLGVGLLAAVLVRRRAV